MSLLPETTQPILRTCRKCGKPKTELLFATFRSRKGELRRRGICHDCRGLRLDQRSEAAKAYRRAYNTRNRTKKQLNDRQRRAEIRAYINKVKDVPCADCGHRWPAVAMDFDHVRGVKEYSIANLVGSAYRLELIIREIAKCEVVCACCHRLRTAARGDNIASTGLTRTPHDPELDGQEDVPRKAA